MKRAASICVLLLVWLPLGCDWSQGSGTPAVEPPVVEPDPEPVNPAPPTISTAPLKIGGGGPRPADLRPETVSLVMRRADSGAIQVFCEDELLGEIREGADGKFSGAGFAAVIDRSNFWIRSKIEIAREKDVPRPALEAVSRALMVGGALQQTFRVLD